MYIPFFDSDAKNMAKDINDALIEVLTRHLQDKPGKPMLLHVHVYYMYILAIL